MDEAKITSDDKNPSSDASNVIQLPLEVAKNDVGHETNPSVHSSNTVMPPKEAGKNDAAGETDSSVESSNVVQSPLEDAKTDPSCERNPSADKTDTKVTTESELVSATADSAMPNPSKKSDDEKSKTEELLLQKEEYSYIQRDIFTSEIFKIEIQQMPRFGFSELRKKLLNLELRPIKIKGFPHDGYAFVTFRNEEDREAALLKINGFQWKGHLLTAKKSRPTADPLVLKRKAAPASEQNSKKPKLDDGNNQDENLTPDERLKKAVMPLYELPYEDQLNVKSSNIKSVLTKLTWEVHNTCPELRGWLKKQKTKNSGCICEILPIMPSPVLKGYRNKSEFTIGMNLEGTERVVGFRFGSYRDGSSAVGDPSNCMILSEAMAKVAKIFQEFVHQSQYPVYDAQTHDGYWRQLTVRTTTLGDIMAIPEFCSQQLSIDKVEEVKNSLKTFFSEGAGKECGVTSLYFNCQNDRHASAGRCNEYEFLMGEKWITESLLEMKFQISPDAFFQVNSLATGVLYKQIAEWCRLESDNVVLDICCGTGTIGLTLANHVKKVIGVEMSTRAIEDAKRNAVLNGVENIEFHCAKAEDVTEQMKVWARSEKAVAIVDPPRPGLRGKVMYAIRRCPQICRLIYVSCNPAGALQNFMDLIRPVSRRIKGEPFYPVKAIPVDLFPHTKHCELVLLFEREKNDSSDV